MGATGSDAELVIMYAITEEEAIESFLDDKFDYDKLLYSSLDYRGAAVATKE